MIRVATFVIFFIACDRCVYLVYLEFFSMIDIIRGAETSELHLPFRREW